MTPKPTSTPIPTVPRYQSQQVVFEGATFDVELPVTPEQFTRGLMSREHLGDREGMLFVYEVEGLHRFWMKDVSFPLDLLYVARDGTIVDIKPGLEEIPYMEAADLLGRRLQDIPIDSDEGDTEAVKVSQ